MAATTQQPTLLGLPTELRNIIYGEVIAASERRTILGRKFVESDKLAEHKVDLQKHFESTITLHPLSRTCRQMHAEFTPMFKPTSSTSYNLVVDNFDLEQLGLFSFYLRMRASPTTPPLQNSLSPSHLGIYLSFQLDSNIIESIRLLRRATLYTPELTILKGLYEDFSLLFMARDPSSGLIDENKVMTGQQAKDASSLLYGLKGQDPTLREIAGRFERLTIAYLHKGDSTLKHANSPGDRIEHIGIISGGDRKICS